MDWQSADAAYVKGTPFVGATIPYHADEGRHLGGFMAWDAVAGRKKWEVKERFPVWSGSLVTAGDVAFYGTLDGWFKAVDANTGTLLWKFKVGSGVVGAPISYRGPDGRQYVAVYSGIGGDWSLVAGDVNAADPADMRPPTDFAPDLARYTSQGGTVWVFAL
jgi:glucose dehydrogenase